MLYFIHSISRRLSTRLIIGFVLCSKMLSLQNELINSILDLLDDASFISTSAVCHALRSLCGRDLQWRIIYYHTTHFTQHSIFYSERSRKSVDDLRSNKPLDQDDMGSNLTVLYDREEHTYNRPIDIGLLV